MIVDRLELVSDGSVFQVSVHEDGQYDVTSHDLDLEYFHVGPTQTARIVAPLMSRDNAFAFVGAGRRFAAVANALRRILEPGRL